MGNFTAAVNPTKFQVCVCVYVGVGGGGSPDAPGLLIKFIWAHINHATKTF